MSKNRKQRNNPPEGSTVSTTFEEGIDSVGLSNSWKMPTTVVVDSNEPDEIAELVASHPDVDKHRIAPLDAADLVVNGIGIERKRPDDFASSLIEDRLDAQVRKLDECYERARILLEGSFSHFDELEHTRLSPQSARGKAAAIDMRWGISVVPTGGRMFSDRAQELLVDYAVRLGRKAVEEPSSGFLQSSEVALDQPLGKRLWGCFDGVGPSRAEALHTALGSPVQSIEPSSVRSELVAVDGIGLKTAESIVEQIQDAHDENPSTNP